MNKEIFDVKDFMERVQDDQELFFELLDIFVNDFKIKREVLGEAIRDRNSEGIEHVAHFLKGSCRNISAKVLGAIFADLEDKGRKGDLEDVDVYLENIDREFRELMACINQIREER